jgi:signal transduction histidine kinase
VGEVASSPLPSWPSPSPTAPPGRLERRLRATRLDVCFAVGLSLAGLPEAVRGTAPWPIGLLLDLGLGSALLWRRRSPIVAFAAISAITLVQWLVGPRERFGMPIASYHLVADIALLVAFFTVAAWESRWRTIGAALVLEAALLFATLHWAGGRSGPALFVLLSGTAAAAGFSGNNRRTRRAYLASVDERAAVLEIERDHQIRLTAAAERARIARDMHDVVAHNLSVMIALADGASYTATADPQQAAATMAQVSATGRQALGEMTRLLGVLRDGDHPTVLQPQPSLADLGPLLAQARTTGLRASLVTEGPLPTLPPGLQVAVYRLVQEALTNTLKHAVDATTATVWLRLRSRRLEVDVVDDGRQPLCAPPAGHGITGMRERAALYGGAIAAGPQPGLGWRVQATFDLSVREPAP